MARRDTAGHDATGCCQCRAARQAACWTGRFKRCGAARVAAGPDTAGPGRWAAASSSATAGPSRTKAPQYAGSRSVSEGAAAWSFSSPAAAASDERSAAGGQAAGTAAAIAPAGRAGCAPGTRRSGSWLAPAGQGGGGRPWAWAHRPRRPGEAALPGTVAWPAEHSRTRLHQRRGPDRDGFDARPVACQFACGADRRA